MPADPLKRSPTDAIIAVLQNGRVQSPFTHQCSALGTDIRNNPGRRKPPIDRPARYWTWPCRR